MKDLLPIPTRGTKSEGQEEGGTEVRSQRVWIFWTERRLLVAMAALVVLTAVGMACSVFL
jgi:hypothetical protein